MNHKAHLKWMAIVAAGAFVVLLLMGKPAGEALTMAVALACPLMMVAMMLGGHSHGHGSQGDGHAGHAPAGRTEGDVSSRH